MALTSIKCSGVSSPFIAYVMDYVRWYVQKLPREMQSSQSLTDAKTQKSTVQQTDKDKPKAIVSHPFIYKGNVVG